MRESNDWAIINIKAPNVFYYNPNKYTNHNKSYYFISPNDISMFLNASKIISDANFDDVDPQIMHAIERLKKSKAATNFNDRVVELSLAFEYLINTQPYEVSLQLCVKAIKLYDEIESEQRTFEIMKKFYGLRSNIVHGKVSPSNNEKNKAIVDFAENVVIRIILKLIELNKSLTFKEISDALDKSLYSSFSLAKLLQNKVSTDGL